MSAARQRPTCKSMCPRGAAKQLWGRSSYATAVGIVMEFCPYGTCSQFILGHFGRGGGRWRAVP
jgi:hypothetical protein